MDVTSPYRDIRRVAPSRAPLTSSETNRGVEPARSSIIDGPDVGGKNVPGRVPNDNPITHSAHLGTHNLDQIGAGVCILPDGVLNAKDFARLHQDSICVIEPNTIISIRSQKLVIRERVDCQPADRDVGGPAHVEEV